MTITIQQNISLKAFNTLALPAHAAFYCEVFEAEQIPETIEFSLANKLPWMLLGEGSNIILASDFAGLVIHIKLRGITASVEKDSVWVDVAAGENWHALVEHTLAQGWFGLENLALIPGTVGASPIQNIGAYGIEVAQRIESVTGWSLEQQCFQILSNQQCQFGYRDSIFKRELKDKFIITQVRLQLSLIPEPVLYYPPLTEQFAHIQNPDPVLIAAAVEKVRREKLPDPAIAPNVGSFFKNPVITESQYQQLKTEYPDMPGYCHDTQVKIPAAWLIDRAGWKGFREQDVGVHAKQALVLVNYGGASGDDILELANRIRNDISKRYGIELEIEPRVYN